MILKNFSYSNALNRLPDQFFAKLAKKAGTYGAKRGDIINLGQGNPDQPTPPHIVNALKSASENPKYHKYPPFQGYDFLKEAVATFYKREYGVELDKDSEVAVLFGGKVGLVEISQCLLNEGDLALMPDPGYPDYLSGIAMANAKKKLMPLLQKNDFLPDYRLLTDKELAEAKLMFLNYPNNPTAGVASSQFFEETVTLADENDICVVHDFAYGAIGFDGNKPISFLQTPGAKEVGIEIYTMSKTYNMAGWRVAFAVGNKSVIDALQLVQDHFYVSLFGGIQEAAAEALLGPQDCVADLVALYESRRNVLIDGLKELNSTIRAPKGSFFAWLPVPEGFTSESFSDFLLEEASIVVAPGIGFGRSGEGFVRVGLLESENRIREAIERIKKLDLF